MVDSLKQNFANFSEREINLSFEVMNTLAKSLGINNGVAAITVRAQFPPKARMFYSAIGTIYCYASKERVGINCMGLTMSKISYMLRTGKDSGCDFDTLGILEGETQVKGGVCKRTAGGSVYVAFTGLGKKDICDETKDLSIAQTGLKSLLPTL